VVGAATHRRLKKATVSDCLFWSNQENAVIHGADFRENVC